VIHSEPHPAAGARMRVKASAKHPQYPEFGGAVVMIEDWADRVLGRSWKDTIGNPAAMIYAFRMGRAMGPHDDECVYAKHGSFGIIIHASELELPEVAG
jgi:hypothetical protein